MAAKGSQGLPRFSMPVFSPSASLDDYIDTLLCQTGSVIDFEDKTLVIESFHLVNRQLWVHGLVTQDGMWSYRDSFLLNSLLNDLTKESSGTGIMTNGLSSFEYTGGQTLEPISPITFKCDAIDESAICVLPELSKDGNPTGSFKVYYEGYYLGLIYSHLKVINDDGFSFASAEWVLIADKSKARFTGDILVDAVIKMLKWKQF